MDPETSQPVKKTNPQWTVVAMLFLAILGLADSSYLTSRHIVSKGGLVTCGLEGCETVLNSTYSEVFGIPLALLGLIFYGIMFLALLWYFARPNKKVLKAASLLPIAGLLASLYFVYLQIFVIQSICAFCMISAGSSTLLFILGMITLKKTKHNERQEIERAHDQGAQDEYQA